MTLTNFNLHYLHEDALTQVTFLANFVRRIFKRIFIYVILCKKFDPHCAPPPPHRTLGTHDLNRHESTLPEDVFKQVRTCYHQTYTLSGHC